MIGNDVDVKVVPLRADEDVVRMRQAVRECLVSVGFSLIDQTKMITAASELGRNTLRYGGGGEAHIQKVVEGGRRGVTLSFIDQGPGIVDVELALTDGYTTGNGMGLGLSGARRLADDFELDTTPGVGTTVRISKWKLF
ncbi:serine/threonine-protein kinase RsbT [Noviherbaspirillum suwonense]|uniref:Serine/threonine-protein kinase RsbT n=2 Tax=Noviherbaspirillum suwonense TaxID=1224511 RepID=A0ABY1QML2_9BURK|nr:serine/threonine-protein kinase RsbT [Noviherbaspirillum suwonense]